MPRESLVSGILIHPNRAHTSSLFCGVALLSLLGMVLIVSRSLLTQHMMEPAVLTLPTLWFPVPPNSYAACAYFSVMHYLFGLCEIHDERSSVLRESLYPFSFSQ